MKVVHTNRELLSIQYTQRRYAESRCFGCQVAHSGKGLRLRLLDPATGHKGSPAGDEGQGVKRI